MKNIGSDDRLVQLAQSVLGATESISQRLHERDLPQPSFDADAPRELPVELETARQQVLDATQELHQLLLGPAELVHSKTVSTSAVWNAEHAPDCCAEGPQSGEPARPVRLQTG